MLKVKEKLLCIFFLSLKLTYGCLKNIDRLLNSDLGDCYYNPFGNLENHNGNPDLGKYSTIGGDRNAEKEEIERANNLLSYPLPFFKDSEPEPNNAEAWGSLLKLRCMDEEPLGGDVDAESLAGFPNIRPEVSLGITSRDYSRGGEDSTFFGRSSEDVDEKQQLDHVERRLSNTSGFDKIKPLLSSKWKRKVNEQESNTKHHWEQDRSEIPIY